MITADHNHWWKGERGEWLVVAQLALIGLVFFGPRTVFGQPAGSFPFASVWPIAGVLLMVMGGVLLLAGLVLALGWALYVQSLLTVGYVVVFFLFLDRKSTHEEMWLAEKYPTYGDYQRRVRKLVPFIY